MRSLWCLLTDNGSSPSSMLVFDELRFNYVIPYYQASYQKRRSRPTSGAPLSLFDSLLTTLYRDAESTLPVPTSIDASTILGRHVRPIDIRMHIFASFRKGYHLRKRRTRDILKLLHKSPLATRYLSSLMAKNADPFCQNGLAFYFVRAISAA